MTQDTDAGPTPAVAPTNDQIRHVADAITTEVARIVARKTKGSVDADDATLLQKVATNAVRFALQPAPADGDEKGKKAQQRKLANLNAQLANIEAIGEVVSADAFWQVVQAVIGRLSSFAIATAVSAAA